MRLNIKKVFFVVLVLILIILGIWAGISLTNTDNKLENETNKNFNKEANLINGKEDKNKIENTLPKKENTIETSNNIASSNSVIDITTDNTTVDNTNSNSTTDSTNKQPKHDLNNYLEKFSLICYIDSRTKELEKEIKRNEDYIDIAMLFAKEHNINGEDVNDKRAISKEKIHKIISEVRGRSTPDILEIADVLYKYDEASNQYYTNQNDERIAHIFEIIENTEENGVINLKYTCCFPSQTQISNNNFSGLGKYVITMELKENTNYEYSKYRIQNYQFVIE